MMTNHTVNTDLANKANKVLNLLLEIGRGKKPVFEETVDKVTLLAQFEVLKRDGKLSEEAIKYFEGTDDTSHFPIIFRHYNGIKEFDKSLYESDQRQPKYLQNFSILYPVRNTQSDITKINRFIPDDDKFKDDAIYINPGSVESLVLLTEVVALKAEGKLRGIPVFIRDKKVNGSNYFDKIFSLLGLEGAEKESFFKENNFHIAQKRANIVKRIKSYSETSDDISLKTYQPDSYRLPENFISRDKKPLVFVINTTNDDKFEQFRRITAHFFGNTVKVYKANQIFGDVYSAEEHSRTFSGNAYEKDIPFRETTKEFLNNGGRAKLKEMGVEPSQIFCFSHDGGIDFGSEFYNAIKQKLESDLNSLNQEILNIENERERKLVERKKVKLIKLLNVDIDAVETKFLMEYFGGPDKMMGYAKDLGVENIVLKEVLNVFPLTDPNLEFSFYADKKCKLVQSNGNGLSQSTSFHYRNFGWGNRSSAELGMVSSNYIPTKKENKFLAEETPLGDVFFLATDFLQISGNDREEFKKKNELVKVAIIGDGSHINIQEVLARKINQQNVLVSNFNPTNNPSEIQETLFRDNNVILFLPEIINGEDHQKSEEDFKIWIKNQFSLTSVYVGKNDLKEPFLDGKMVIFLVPEEYKNNLDKVSFEWANALFRSTMKNFGKGNADLFRVIGFIGDTKEISKILNEQNLKGGEINELLEFAAKKYEPKRLPEKTTDFSIPEIANNDALNITVFGSATTEHPSVIDESKKLCKWMFCNGIGYTYGGMQRGIGTGLNELLKAVSNSVTLEELEKTTDEIKRIPNSDLHEIEDDEMFIKEFCCRVNSGEIQKPLLGRIYTGPSRDVEGFVQKEELPKVVQNSFNFVDYEAREIYQRMDIMNHLSATKGQNLNSDISIMMPGSMGTYQEYFFTLLKKINNPEYSDRKILVYNMKKDGIDGEHRYFQSLLDETLKYSGCKNFEELEKKHGIKICNEFSELTESVTKILETKGLINKGANCRSAP